MYYFSGLVLEPSDASNFKKFEQFKIQEKSLTSNSNSSNSLIADFFSRNISTLFTLKFWWGDVLVKVIHFLFLLWLIFQMFLFFLVEKFWKFENYSNTFQILVQVRAVRKKNSYSNSSLKKLMFNPPRIILLF